MSIMAPVWNQTALRHKKWKKDYYPKWSVMSYHWLSAVVYVRNKFQRTGNGPERLTKHAQQLDVSCNIQRNSAMLSSRNTIVIMSWWILVYRMKIVTMISVFLIVFCGMVMIWRHFSMVVIFFFCQLGPDYN